MLPDTAHGGQGGISPGSAPNGSQEGRMGLEMHLLTAAGQGQE